MGPQVSLAVILIQLLRSCVVHCCPDPQVAPVVIRIQLLWSYASVSFKIPKGFNMNNPALYAGKPGVIWLVTTEWLND